MTLIMIGVLSNCTEEHLEEMCTLTIYASEDYSVVTFNLTL
jgi:hypothetical protein